MKWPDSTMVLLSNMVCAIQYRLYFLWDFSSLDKCSE